MPFLLVAPFVVVIAGLVVVGLASMAQSQSSGFVGWLEQTLGRAAVFAVPFAQAAVDLTRWIAHKLGQHFAGIERLTVGWLAGLANYVDRINAMSLLWPLELFKTTYWLIWHEIPRQIAALPNTATRVVHAITTRVVRVERTVIRLPKLSRSQARALIGAAVATYVAPYLLPLRWLREHFHALTAVLPHTLPIPFGRTIAGIRARLRRLEKVTAGGLAVAAVATALARLNLGWVRCSNVAKTGKALCRANARWLENLLLGTLMIFGTISLRTFAVEVYALTGDAVKAVAHFWRADVGGGGGNPGLGDSGGTDVALRPQSYVRPSPGLGDVA